MAKTEKERKLTEKEAKRTERLAEIAEELRAKGLVREDKTVSLLAANLLAPLWALPFALILIPCFFAANDLHFGSAPGRYFLFLLLLLLATVVHELIHGLTWGLFSPKGFFSIEFGFIAEMLTPYCYCGEPLKKGPYLAGSLMPFLLLGLLPSIAGVLSGSMLLLLLGLVMIMGAGGDMTVSAKLLFMKLEKGSVIMDHPTECGFVLFRPENAEGKA